MPKPAKRNARKSAKKKTGKCFVIRPGRKGDWPFSDGVWAGSTFYLSGHLGLDSETRLPPAQLDREIHLMLDTFRATLAAAGLGMRDLVYVQIFCPEVSLFDTFNVIYRTYFGKNFPARAFLGSGPLLFGAKFEIQGIAARG
jgi:enamine deaminase RidA (YjgF/YER057c/UK114 family)